MCFNALISNTEITRATMPLSLLTGIGDCRQLRSFPYPTFSQTDGICHGMRSSSRFAMLRTFFQSFRDSCSIAGAEKIVYGMQNSCETWDCTALQCEFQPRMSNQSAAHLFILVFAVIGN